MRYQQLARCYTDQATVYRLQQGKVDGETVQQSQLLYPALPCRLSQAGLPRNQQTSAQNDIRYEAKMFCSPEWKIRQGDMVELERDGNTRRYTAGEPFLYSTHQEINLQRKEWA